jgi:hypothetical protein
METTDAREAYPYPPSWLDRFTEWVERLPGRSWVFYPAIGLVLASILTAVNWADGTYPIGTFNAFHIMIALQTPYFLALTRYLDGVAEAALRNFQPALEVSEEEYDELLYRLTTAPARPALLGSLAGVAVNVLLFSLVPNPFTVFGYSTVSSSYITLIGLNTISLGVIGALIYHTFHQLRLVSHIFADRAIVNLFDLSPLYAFSGLTSKTAVGFLIINYIWVVTAPQQLISTSAVIGMTIFMAVVSIVTFTWPLLGVHGRLVQEKQRLLRESSQHLEATIAKLRACGREDAGELHSIDELHVTMACLETEQSMLNRIPTWPWRSETLRGLVSALLLPLVVFVLQFVLQRFFAQ